MNFLHLHPSDLPSSSFCLFRFFVLSFFQSFFLSFFLSFNLFYPHFCLSFLLRPIFISISSSYQFFDVVICCFNSLTSFHNKRKAFSCASPRCFCNLFSCFNVFIMAYKLAITSDCAVIIDFPVVSPWEKLAFFRTLHPLHVLWIRVALRFCAWINARIFRIRYPRNLLWIVAAKVPSPLPAVLPPCSRRLFCFLNRALRVCARRPL